MHPCRNVAALLAVLATVALVGVLTLAAAAPAHAQDVTVGTFDELRAALTDPPADGEIEVGFSGSTRCDTPIRIPAGRSAVLDLTDSDIELICNILTEEAPAIYLQPGARLTITSSTGGGRLRVEAGSGSGIGGQDGVIRIESGTIDVLSAQAGIGAGPDVIVTGGDVTAIVSDGAGLGSAADGGGSVQIAGGTVFAESVSGAAIGSGRDSAPVDVTITGGTVTAHGGENHGAQGGSGVGIGAGSDSQLGNVLISGGVVEARGGGGSFGLGPGIGGTKPGHDGGSITISGGRVHAVGASTLPGIGSQSVVDISITGGDVYAESQAAAAIGGPGPLELGGGHLVAAAMWTRYPAIDVGDVVLHGSPTAGSAGHGADGTTAAATVFSHLDTPGVLYTATARDADAATGDTARAEVRFHAEVAFDAAGGAPAPPGQVVDWDSPATEPAAPARAGYAFGGWHVGTATGDAWDFDVPVTGPLTLVAAWTSLAPAITGPTTASAIAGEPFGYLPTVNGPDVGVTATGLPAGLQVEATTGEVRGTPAGSVGDYLVTLTATNPFGTATHAFTLTLGHGAAVSFRATASDPRPMQGATITIAVTATDGFGNAWDASGEATITSNVTGDRVRGNRVTFPHASPHVLTVALGALTPQSLTIQVIPVTASLGLTGAGFPWPALVAAALAVLVGVLAGAMRADPDTGRRSGGWR